MRRSQEWILSGRLRERRLPRNLRILQLRGPRLGSLGLLDPILNRARRGISRDLGVFGGEGGWGGGGWFSGFSILRLGVCLRMWSG